MSTLNLNRLRVRRPRQTCVACAGEGTVPTESLCHFANVVPGNEARSYCEDCSGEGTVRVVYEHEHEPDDGEKA